MNHLELKPKTIMILCPKCHVSEHMKNGSWGRGLKKTKICVVCGNIFVPNHSKKHKSCSSKCLSELGRLNAMKRWYPTEQKELKDSEMQ